jgi:hypothetical protein
LCPLVQLSTLTRHPVAPSARNMRRTSSSDDQVSIGASL